MRTEKLTPREQQIFSDYYRKNKMLAPVIPGSLLICLVLWLLNGSDIQEMHWAVAGVILFLFVIVTSSILWRLNAFKKDSEEKSKLVGEYEITDTRVDRRNFYVWIDMGRSKRLRVTQGAFNKLGKHGRYHFEITAHSGIVLKIANGNDLIYEIR